MRTLAAYLARVAVARLRTPESPATISYPRAIQDSTWACTDLGAFARPASTLVGLPGLVLMEDRHPQFFLSFREFTPLAPTGLNRHGPLREWSTHQDLRALVGTLYAQGVRVLIGFWNYGARWPLSKSRWLRQHPELRCVPRSADLDPFVRLEPEGVSYANYIGQQYQRLQAVFGFDGLMLGDGFCGFGSFMNPDWHDHHEDAIPQWTHLYHTIARRVHRAGGVLFAYDRMGASYQDARRHGVDYRAIADAGLDTLVYQAYPQAWGTHCFPRSQDRFGLAACARNLDTVRTALTHHHTQVLYTVELGDSVERWGTHADLTQAQMATLDPLADGRFLVWANTLLAGHAATVVPSPQAHRVPPTRAPAGATVRSDHATP